MLAGKITEEDEEDILAELDDIIAEEAREKPALLPDVPLDAVEVYASTVPTFNESLEEPEDEKPDERMIAA